MPAGRPTPCGASPLDGAALFADGHDAKDHEGLPGRSKHFCPEHLPLSAIRRRLERQIGPLLDAAVAAVFQRRLGATS